MVALIVLRRLKSGPGRRDRTTGEPEGTWSTPRIGPRRSSRSFNDDVIVVHPLHHHVRQHSEICRPKSIGNRSFHMKATKYQRASAFFRLGHYDNRPVGMENLDRDHWRRRQVGNQVELDVVGPSRHSCTPLAY